MIIVSLSLIVFVGSVVTLYGGLMGHFGDEIVVKLFVMGTGFMLMFFAFYIFVIPTTVTSGCTELLDVANGLRAKLPIERMDEVNHLVAYLEDLHAGQGPGYCVGGKLISARLIGGACATTVTAAASLSLSLIETV